MESFLRRWWLVEPGDQCTQAPAAAPGGRPVLTTPAGEADGPDGGGVRAGAGEILDDRALPVIRRT
jgi:hypothetical protein